MSGTTQNGTAVVNFLETTLSEGRGDNCNGTGKTPAVEVVVEHELQLKKTLNFVGGSSVIIGGIIGTGIFITPNLVLLEAHSVGLTLLLWLVAGLLAIGGAACYSELGTRVCRSGGEYAYLREAFGAMPAFLFAWTSVLVIRTASLAIITLSLASFAATLVSHCSSSHLLVKGIAAAVLVTILLVNAYSIRLTGYVMVVTTICKLLTVLTVIVCGFFRLASGETEELSTGFQGSATSPGSLAMALCNALWAYDGWNMLNYITEEMHNPRRDLPRASILGVTTVTVSYLLINAAYLAVLPRKLLLSSPAAVVTWAERALGRFSSIISFSVVISAFGAANTSAFAASRVVYAAARDGCLPEVLSYVSANHFTPIPSLVVTVSVALVMVVSGQLHVLLAVFTLASWLAYGSAFLALLVLRRRHQGQRAPFQTPLPVPVLMLLMSVLLVVLPIVQQPQLNYLYSLAFLLTGLALYLPLVRWQLLACDGLTTFLQLLLNVAPSSTKAH